MNIAPRASSAVINCSGEWLLSFRVKASASYLFPLISFLFHDFYFQGGSEEEVFEALDEIIRKEKKAKKKVKSVSRGKRVKKEMILSYTEESDAAKLYYEDRMRVPQGSSEEREVNESSGALREENVNVGGSPREIDSSSPYGARITEISDDMPLVDNIIHPFQLVTIVFFFISVLISSLLMLTDADQIQMESPYGEEKRCENTVMSFKIAVAVFSACVS